MRCFSIAPAALAGVLVLACVTDPTQPSSPHETLSAAVVTNERTHVIDLELVNACTGEAIPLTGTIHDLISVTETGTGVFKLVIHSNWHLVGTSPTTGESVVFNNAEVSIFPDVNFSFFEGTDEFTSRFISKGAAPNAVLRFKYHLTFNANGTPTSSFEDFTLRCQ
jgi:hypothetical protein